jgi:CubicO group peptidase (beta-lactamase class C family)
VAYALGKIYEMPFEEYMLKKVFIPLEMANSTYRQDDYLMRVDSAVGHGKGSLVKYPIMMIGAGGMYSCPNDMTHFIRCFLNQGVYNGQRIIDQEILKKMYSEYPRDTDFNTDIINKRTGEWSYNLGLDVGIVNKKIILNHNGGGFGFFATQDIVLDSRLGAAALINSTEHPTVQLTIIRNMWDDFFALQDAEKDDCEHISDKNKSLIGLYEANFNGGSRKLAVIPRNGGIYCNNQKLEHHFGNLFFNEKNDCIEFTENGMIYDNVMFNKCHE